MWREERVSNTCVMLNHYRLWDGSQFNMSKCDLLSYLATLLVPPPSSSVLYNQAMALDIDYNLIKCFCVMFAGSKASRERNQAHRKSHVLNQSLSTLVHPQLITGDMLLGLWLKSVATDQNQMCRTQKEPARSIHVTGQRLVNSPVFH